MEVSAIMAIVLGSWFELLCTFLEATCVSMLRVDHLIHITCTNS